jgi:hypothetical protein
MGQIREKFFETGMQADFDYEVTLIGDFEGRVS